MEKNKLKFILEVDKLIKEYKKEIGPDAPIVESSVHHFFGWLIEKYK